MVYMTESRPKNVKRPSPFAAPVEAAIDLYGLGMRIVLLVIRHP